MANKPNELRFEEHIEKALNSKGYNSLLYSVYNRKSCVIEDELIAFLKDTQPKVFGKLEEQFGANTNERIFTQLKNKIAKDGIIKTLREGISTRGCSFDLLYFQPKSGLNEDLEERYQKNRFVTVRQLHYSIQNENSIDIVLFLNGIPLITMELKNQLTGQNVKNAEYQYKNDRDPKEPLLAFKKCLVHFAVDNTDVSMTTRLNGKKTFFLPYNKGITNPTVADDYATEYLWNDILTPDSVLDIIENFVVLVKEKDKEWSAKENRVIEKTSEILIFPRYHQLDVIRKLRTDIKEVSVGKNYLIQHTTGSGKSFSIGWLSHMLTSLYKSKEDTNRVFDSIIVITDRKVLDKQLQNTLTQLEKTKGVVKKIDQNSEQLKIALEQGKSIIVTTIQKFSVVVEKMTELKGKTFGVVIDEVHSSQTGESAKNLKKVLSYTEGDEDEEEDSLLDIIKKEQQSRKAQSHISFFGFTGTPKNKTLELFGEKTAEGTFKAFHSYSMQQSIKEGFTLDVLKNYTTYSRYFKVKQSDSSEDEKLPEGKALRELMSFVDKSPIVIQQKATIILNHFVKVASKKINGQGRGMIVLSSRMHCVLFFLELKKQMKERNLSYSCLVAFSDSINHLGQDHTEGSLNTDNGVVGKDIPSALKDPRYKLLIVSDKFQTGFDEPLLHSMYVDKRLGGVQCVQTLSRLNRTKSGKSDTFVLDFVNDTEDIVESFQPYFKSTELSGETEPDKLYELQSEIEAFNLFDYEQIDAFCIEFFKNTDTDETLQPILYSVVKKWKELDEDKQRDEFKSMIQSFCRMYSYISQLMTFEEPTWEKLFIFLKYLNKLLPKGLSEKIDLTDSIDLSSLRIQLIAESNLSLSDEKGELDPMSDTSGGSKDEEEEELLSAIIKRVNETFGIELKEEDLLDLKNIGQRIQSNEHLERVMIGNNSEDDKKKEFQSALKNEVSGFYGDKIDFFKKVMKKEVFPLIMDAMFTEYRKQQSL